MQSDDKVEGGEFLAEVRAEVWNEDLEDVEGEAPVWSQDLGYVEVKATFDWRAFALGLLISSMLWWSMIAFVWRMIE